MLFLMLAEGANYFQETLQNWDYVQKVNQLYMYPYIQKYLVTVFFLNFSA